MLIRTLLWTLLLLAGTTLSAQTVRLHGKVTDNKLQPLAFATIQVKELQYGVTSKEDGTYSLSLEEGTYTLVVSMIGYKNQVITLTLDKDYEQNILMEESDASMEDIVIRVKARDRAEELIRQVIRHKDQITSAAGPYSVRTYIKAVRQDSSGKKKGRELTTDSDLDDLSLAEIGLKVDADPDGRMKEERLGVKQTGRSDGLFYRSATEGSFNFYENLIRVPSISATTFLSPFSYSGLMAYRFKTIRIEKKGGQKLYTISVRPRQLSNATVEGEVTVSDSSWAVLHARFRFPSYHLTAYDYFEVDQTYSWTDGKAWMLSRQLFTYGAKSKGGKLSGQTLVTYSDYELQKQFPKNHFGLEVSATAATAYEQDSTFWQTVRTEPLSEREVRLLQYRDSIYRATHTKAYLDSIDRLTNRLTWKKLGLTGQTFYNREKERTWMLPPLVTIYNPIQFGGGRIQPGFYFEQHSRSRKNISIDGNLSYGIRNQDLNANLRLKRLYDPFRRGFFMLDFNRDFARLYEGDAWINQIKRSSFFLNNYLAVGHGIELLNGLQLYTELEAAVRRSVSDYKTNAKLDSLLGDLLQDNQPIPFEAYNAAYTKVRLQYTPRQRYLREPREKVILGSKWPTFYVLWRKGIPETFSSKADFDYVEYGIEQQVNAGVLGLLRYHLKSGSFVTRKQLRLPDYQYQRRGDPFLFMNPDESFQALDSTFAVFGRYYQGHFVHEFNGAFVNRLPLLKKLQLREVAGLGFLFVPERKLRYAELFAGLERVFRLPFQIGDPMDKYKVGIYVAGSIANGYNNPIQFKVGFTKWDRRKNKWR